MADMIVPFQDDEELENAIAAELSKNDDIVDYIHVSSLDALRARFGEAEEDESIREEGFELAKKGGLVRKPRPEESAMPYAARDILPRDDIRTDSDTGLSQVFENAKSEHDSDNVLFSDLSINGNPDDKAKPEANPPEEKKTQEEPKKTEEEPPKRKRGRPRKNPLPEPKPPEKEEEKKEEEKYEEEQETGMSISDKFNTHTEIIYIDESLDDGIKRNSETELEALFNKNQGGKVSGLWKRKKK